MEATPTRTPPRSLAVSVAIWEPGERGRLFLVRRPESPDEEFPGLWGLPAATLRPGETPQEAIARLGRHKLGIALRPGELLARGEQLRSDTVLTMLLYAAIAEEWPPRLPAEGEEGVTRYTEWRWGEPRLLLPTALMGSLCCRLLLDTLGEVWP